MLGVESIQGQVLSCQACQLQGSVIRKGISDSLSRNALLLSQCRIVSSIAWVTIWGSSCGRLERGNVFGPVYW